MNRRVLLILDDCGAGDAARLGFCVKAVRQSLPDAHLTLVVSEESADVYAASPLIDRLVVSRLYRRPLGGRLRKLVELCRLVLATGTRFDLAIVFWWGSTLLDALARVASRGKSVGYSATHGWLLSDALGPFDFEGDEMVQNRRLLSAAGIDFEAPAVPEIATSAADSTLADAALVQAGWDGSRPLVILHPGSDWACQQWPVERWAVLADGLAADGAPHLVFTGSAGEVPLVESIRSAMTTASRSLAGSVSLPQLGRVLEHASLVVTVDSAVYVLAQAKGTRTVVLAGPSHPERIAGIGTKPSIVKKMDPEMVRKINDCKRPRYPGGGCQDWSCPMAGLREIDVSDVLEAASQC